MNFEKAERAKGLFKNGYNCSQSVLGVWAEELGLDFNTAMKISQSFGGGMGRLREVCGACSGAFMVLGMKYGTENSKDFEAKKFLYEKVQKFAARFKEENNFDSIICRDMLGLTGTSKFVPAERTSEYYKKRPCVELVCLAAGLLDEFM